MIKEKFKKLSVEQMLSEQNKAKYDRFTTNIILNKAKLKLFPLRSGSRQGGPLLLLFSIILEVFTRAVGQEKEIKDI